MPELTQLVNSFSWQRPRFMPCAVYVGAVVEKWHWGRILSKSFDIPINIIPPMLYILTSITSV
jgi:hypothetical protein